MCAGAFKIWVLSTSIPALNAAIADQSIWGVVLYPRGCTPPVLGYSNQHSAGAGIHRCFTTVPFLCPAEKGDTETEFLALAASLPLRLHFPMQ